MLPRTFTRITLSSLHRALRASSSSSVRLPIANVDGSQVTVTWDGSERSSFHNIWLRDHCRCPKCFHPITKQRLFNTFELPKDIKPSSIQPGPDGLEVTWPSSSTHKSVYPWRWLQENSYNPKSQDPVSSSVKKTLWGSEIKQGPPTVPYDQVMSQTDEGLYKWLSNIASHLHLHPQASTSSERRHGVPVSPEATEELSERIGFIRETQYGKFWEFTSDLTKGDTAYTTLALGAHTDNTYFTDPCGLQLFHLLSHTDGEGGATLLVDGFHVASLVKENHPDAYALLSSIPIPAHAAGEASSFYCPSPTSGYPVINHDRGTGSISAIRWNNDDRSVMNNLEPDVVEKWYDALRTWHRYLTSPEAEYWVQLQPGTAVVVDNHRVLHGRSAFNGKRRMCGAYISVDEYRSKLTVMREKFAASKLEATVEQNRSVWHPLL